MSEERQTNPSLEKKAQKRAESRKATADKVKDYLLPESHPWANGGAILGGVGVVAIGIAAAIGWNHPRFAFSYLFAFLVFLSIALGSLFFVLIQHLTSAGWSVTMRRTAEFFMAAIVVLAILFVPVWLKRATLFPWLRVEKHATTETTAALQAGQGGGNGQGGGHGTGRGVGTGAQHGGTAEQNPSAAANADDHAQGDGPAVHHRGQEPAEAEGSGEGTGTGGGAGNGMGTGGGNHRGGAPRHAGIGTAHGGGAAAGPGAHAESAEAAEEAALQHEEHENLEGKKAYLNESAFGIRALVYFGLWALISLMMFNYSTKQDTTKDPKLTVKVQRFAAPMTPVFALTLTFAAFDWIMSLDPTWFSTIFGVYYFAGCVLGGFSTLILATMAIRRTGLLRTEINVEHYHDIGKLLFGFLVFWAYIGFAQFMLIWYAAIPEEVTFFHHRWDEGPWKNFSLMLVFGNFVVPFFVLMSRNTKRKLGGLAFGAALVLITHVIDVYWLVMPNFAQADFGFDVQDILCLVGVGGVYLGAVLWLMRRNRLIPVGDPRLVRALRFENA